MRAMRSADDELQKEKDLEGLLRRLLVFCSPKNRHRIKASRRSGYIKVREV